MKIFKSFIIIVAFFSVSIFSEIKFERKNEAIAILKNFTKNYSDNKYYKKYKKDLEKYKK